MPERFESTTIMAGSHEDWRSLLPPAKESWPQSVKIAHQQISTNQSLTIQQGLDFFDEPNLHAIGELAHDIKTARFGQMVFLMPTFTLTKQIFALLHAGFVHLGEEDVQKMHMP